MKALVMFSLSGTVVPAGVPGGSRQVFVSKFWSDRMIAQVPDRVRQPELRLMFFAPILS